MTSTAKDNADRHCLAALFVDGPELSAPAEAEQRLAAWLADLEPPQAAAIRDLAGRHPRARGMLLGIVEASPYLFDLIRADAARALRLLHCDPGRQLAVIPVNALAAMVQLIPLADANPAEMRENESRLGDQYTRMHGTPFVMRRRFLRAPAGAPCVPPPWGSLIAIDLASGAMRWSVPLGDPSTLLQGLPAPAASPLGLPNLGGAILTAGGVAFVGATFDHFLRAFDTETGRELWRGSLPAGARATPMTYSAAGRQYVIICVGGGDDWGRGDSVVAFTLR